MSKFSGIALYNNRGMKYLLLPTYSWLRHTLYIGFILAFWTAFGWRYFSEGIKPVLQLAAYALSYVGIIYFNFLVLMPRLLYKNRIVLYLVYTYLSFFSGYTIQHAIYSTTWDEFMQVFVFDEERIRDMVINAITFIMFCGVGWAFSMFKMWLTGENKIVQLENEKLQAELNNLKHQVNPHFLFNTFNSLYVTSKTSPDKVPDMILDLADLMRYQLEDCSKQKVPLENEIAYIKNFIEIERVRKDDADIKFDIEGNTENILIEPLLFIPIVENAFKHGLGKMEKGYVFITLSTRNDRLVYLKVKNSKPTIQLNGKTHGYGIGLSNLSKRLAMGYPNKHELRIAETKETYTVFLQLQAE